MVAPEKETVLNEAMIPRCLMVSSMVIMVCKYATSEKCSPVNPMKTASLRVPAPYRVNDLIFVHIYFKLGICMDLR